MVQCDVTQIICISNKVEYLDKENRHKNATKDRSYIVNSSDFCNVLKKILDKFTCHTNIKIEYSNS